MKAFHTVAALLTLALTTASPVAAQEIGTPGMGRGHITVTGEGMVQASPDMATISLGVETEAATAAEAMDENSAALSGVMETLSAAGIAPRDIQTSGLNLSPVYEEYREGAPADGPRVRAFRAQNTVTVRVRALDQLGGVLDAAVGSGANTLYGLGFGLQDPQPKMDEARAAAVADARRKAELYAQAAGVTLGPVAAISEQGGMPVPMMEMRAASFAKDSGVPVSAGELDLSANVTVVWELGEAQPPRP